MQKKKKIQERYKNKEKNNSNKIMKKRLSITVNTRIQYYLV